MLISLRRAFTFLSTRHPQAPLPELPPYLVRFHPHFKNVRLIPQPSIHRWGSLVRLFESHDGFFDTANLPLGNPVVLVMAHLDVPLEKITSDLEKSHSSHVLIIRNRFRGTLDYEVKGTLQRVSAHFIKWTPANTSEALLLRPNGTHNLDRVTMMLTEEHRLVFSGRPKLEFVQFPSAILVTNTADPSKIGVEEVGGLSPYIDAIIAALLPHETTTTGQTAMMDISNPRSEPLEDE